VARIALQFLSAQVHGAGTLIIDNALLHAPSEILAQKSGAVAGIGDPGMQTAPLRRPASPMPATNDFLTAPHPLDAVA